MPSKKRNTLITKDSKKPKSVIISGAKSGLFTLNSFN